MQATGEDLHAGLAALTLLVGVMLASDPRRAQLIQLYEEALEQMNQYPEWEPVAQRVKAYGESIVETLSPAVAGNLTPS